MHSVFMCEYIVYLRYILEYIVYYVGTQQHTSPRAPPSLTVPDKGCERGMGEGVTKQLISRFTDRIIFPTTTTFADLDTPATTAAVKINKT